MFGKKKNVGIKEPLDNPSGRFELCESLEAVVEKDGLDPFNLSVAILLDEQENRMVIESRNSVFLSDGKKGAEWKVGSLRGLFRGNEPAPSAERLARYPAEFVPLFASIEQSLSLFESGSGLPPTDGEFLDAFSALRRRPDGRSLGMLHDFVWVNTAFMLGQYRCSESLYLAIMNRLERSVRAFKIGMSSRNYFDQVLSRM